MSKPRIASEGDGVGLTADEFMAGASQLIAQGHHPLAIGKVNPDKPNKPAGKAPWHRGVTGYDGRDPHPDRVADWPGNVAARIRDGEPGVLNLGMRMPVGGIGVDVDAYDGKHGLGTIAEYESRLGSLPKTYRITARSYIEGSGIRLYRVPDDWSGKTVLKSDGGSDGHVELIQRHHRLAAVPPSHHHTGARYKVYDERTGAEVAGGVVPALEDWPKLPDHWLDGVRASPAKAGGGGQADGEAVSRFAAEHRGNAQPWHLAEYVVPSVRNATSGTRSATFEALHEAARMARVGWYPWSTAREEIEAAARASYADRGDQFDGADFVRSAERAVAQANAESLPQLEQRASRRLATQEAHSRVRRALAPGGRWHPDTFRAWLANEGAPAADSDGPPSWAPVDIRAARRGETLAPPTILRRSDGAFLFYRGKVHSVHGESESGKSWLVQCATADCLLAGESVLYVDFEDEAAAVAERLILLGVPDKVVEDSAKFVYVRPDQTPSTNAEQAAYDALLHGSYALAIIDGVTDSMGVFGLSTKDNDDIARWQRALPKAIARQTGAAVVCVDHVTKDADTRGRFALGGQHKMAGLSGAAYLVEMEQPFAVGQAGRASVRVGKDRPGRVRGLGGKWRKSDRTQHVADFWLDSTNEDRTAWSLDVPENAGTSTETDEAKPTSGKRAFRPTWFMERVSRYWEETDDPASRSNNKTVNAMCEERKEQGKTQHRDIWRDAIRLLESEGYSTSIDGPRESKLYSAVKPYREVSDPLSDKYSKTAAKGVEGWKVKLDPAELEAES
jgi:hypothetical protein